MATTVGQAQIHFLPNFSGFAAATRTQMNSISAEVMRAGATMNIGLLLPVAAGFAKMTKDAAEFEKTMKDIQSIVSGGNLDLFGDNDVKQMETLIRDVAKTSVFTATEVADASVFVARTGVKIKDTIRDITAGSSDLALAANIEDLEKVADISTNIAKVTGIIDKEGRLVPRELADGTALTGVENFNHLLNQLFQTTANANTDLLDLWKAFQRGGPVMDAFGQDIEGTLGLIQFGSDRGFKGSLSSTAILNAAANISKDIPKNQDVLAKYGLTVADVSLENNKMAESLAKLQKAGLGESDALSIFGQRAGPVIMQAIASSESIAELNENINELSYESLDAAGKSMFDAARNMELSLINTTKLAISAFQELGFSIAELGSQKLLYRFVNQATGQILKLTDAISNNQEMARTMLKTLLGFTAIGPINFLLERSRVSFGMFAQSILLFAKNIPKLTSMFLIVNFLKNMWDNSEILRDSISVLANQFLKWEKTLIKLFKTFGLLSSATDSFSGLIGDMVGGLLLRLNDRLNRIRLGIDKWASSTSNLQKRINSTMNIVTDLVKGLGKGPLGLQGQLAAISKIWGDPPLLVKIREGLSYSIIKARSLAQHFANLTTAVVGFGLETFKLTKSSSSSFANVANADGLGGKISILIDEIQTKMKPVKEVFSFLWSTLSKIPAAFRTGFFDGMGTLSDQAKKSFDLFSSFSSGSGGFGGFIAMAAEQLGKLLPSLISIAGGLMPVLAPVISQAGKLVVEVVSLINNMANMFARFSTHPAFLFVATMIGDMLASIPKVLTGITRMLNGLFEWDLGKVGSGLWEAIIGALSFIPAGRLGSLGVKAVGFLFGKKAGKALFKFMNKSLGDGRSLTQFLDNILPTIETAAITLLKVGPKFFGRQLSRMFAANGPVIQAIARTFGGLLRLLTTYAGRFIFMAMVEITKHLPKITEILKDLGKTLAQSMLTELGDGLNQLLHDNTRGLFGRTIEESQRLREESAAKLARTPGLGHLGQLQDSFGMNNPDTFDNIMGDLLADLGKSITDAIAEDPLAPDNAQGGIFNKRTLGYFGEAGREAILPLTRPYRMAELLKAGGVAEILRDNNLGAQAGFGSDSGGNTYHIHGVDPVQVLMKIAAIDEAEARNIGVPF